MSSINVCDNVQNTFNIKYMANNNQKKKPHGKQFTVACHPQIPFRIQGMHSKNNKQSIINNHS